MKNQNKRIIALDVGTKTVGIARTDPLGLTIQPLTTLRYKGLHQTRHVLEKLLSIISENRPQTIVVGLPLNRDKSEGLQAQKVKNLINALKNFVKKNNADLNRVQWVFWDEDRTTLEAEKFLIAQDVSREKRKKVIDQMAAVYILRSYLESQGLDA